MVSVYFTYVYVLLDVWMELGDRVGPRAVLGPPAPSCFVPLCCSMAELLKIMSWNVRGLNDKVKRTAIFRYIKSVQPHVILLQETHLDGSRVLALKRPWIQRIFNATYSTYARGVSILLGRNAPCSIQKVITILADGMLLFSWRYFTGRWYW